MDQFFQIEILLTAICSGLITWIITWSSFKRQQKKEQDNRIREVLSDMIEALLEYQSLLESFEEIYEESLDKRSVQFLENQTKKIERSLKKEGKIIFKLEKIESILFMYDLIELEKTLNRSSDRTEVAYNDFLKVTDSSDMNLISKKISTLREVFEEEFDSILESMKKVYPK